MSTDKKRKITQVPSAKKGRKILKIIGIVLVVFVGLIIFILVGYINQNKTYYQTGLNKIRDAGFVEKQVQVDGYKMNYAEGPKNGVPLLLIHGQGSQWQDYMNVLAQLSDQYYVFAIDVYGHGQSDRLPANMYTNRQVSTMIATFMRQVIKEPAVVSGHSSGGLMAAQIAADYPKLVRGLVLEDPPLFSSIMPRAEKTTGGDLMRITRDYVGQNVTSDFQAYYVRNSSYFEFFGGLEQSLKDYSANYADKHPGQPIEIFFLPPTVNIFFQGLSNYDPVFGEAWHDNRWYDGFDTAASLAKINTPVVLIHTNFWFQQYGSYYNEEGVLMAAMDGDDVAKTKDLVRGLEVVDVKSGHLVHFEKPDEYIRVLRDFASRLK